MAVDKTTPEAVEEAVPLDNDEPPAIVEKKAVPDEAVPDEAVPPMGDDDEPPANVEKKTVPDEAVSPMDEAVSPMGEDVLVHGPPDRDMMGRPVEPEISVMVSI